MVEYVIEGKIAVIIGCTDDEVEVIIPDKIEDYRVGKIKENAFFDLPNLSKVIIPKYVKVIGAYAFSGCKNLTNVTFSEGVETIEDWAFSGCGIQSISLPKTLKFLGVNSFLGCPCKNKINVTVDKRIDTEKEIHIVNNSAVVLPKKVLDELESLSVDTINKLNEHNLIQLNSYNKLNVIDYLDLPFIFNQSEFVIAFYTLQTFDKLRIELSDETIKKYGNYQDDNEDYIIAKINIYNDNTLISCAYMIIPFCDSIKLEVEEISYFESGENNIYLINCKSKMITMGSGNPDREFALNVCEQYRNKFKLQYQNEIITEEAYVKIDDTINLLTFEETKKFLKQIKGSPVLSFIITFFNKLIKDKENDLVRINAFIIKRINEIYYNLSDYTSLEDICFNYEQMVKQIEDDLEINVCDLKEKYQISIKLDGKDVDLNQVESAREAFVEEEENYELYIKTLGLIYKGLLEINDTIIADFTKDYLEYYNKE